MRWTVGSASIAVYRSQARVIDGVSGFWCIGISTLESASRTRKGPDDGAYRARPYLQRTPLLRRDHRNLRALVHHLPLTYRIARHLERRGLLIRDLESSHLTRAPGEDAALEILQSHSITYRIAVGPHEGRKAFTLQTVPARERTTKPFLATHAGFSLHAGVAVRGGDRKTLERLCRYITRPALAEGRLSLTPQGRVRYTLKTPYRDGTTHVVLAPLDFIARLAALVPKPRVHLTLTTRTRT